MKPIKKKFQVEVYYQTNSGNPSSTRKIVSAVDEISAIDIAVSKVKARKTVMKVVGGDCESCSIEYKTKENVNKETTGTIQ